MAVGIFVKVEDPGTFVEKLAQLAAALFANERVSLSATVTAGTTLHVDNQGAEIPSSDRVRSFSKLFKGKRHVLVKDAKLTLQHGNTPITYETQDGIVGRFNLNFGDDTARADLFLQSLETNFSVTSAKDVISARMAHGEAAAVQMRERSVADLKEQLDKLTAFLAELAVRETEHRRKVQEELDEEYRKRQVALDEEIRAKREALDKLDAERNAALAEKAKAFEIKLTEFQTEEAKLMRRQREGEIKKVLDSSKEFTLSAATSAKRKDIESSVKWLLLVSASIIGAMLLAILVTAARGQELHWFYFAPLGLSSATFVTTIVYSLKWRDRWFREHAD